MQTGDALVLGYIVILLVLSINGVHRLWLLVWLWRSPAVVEPAVMSELPRVTVQLPLFNERLVVERAVEAVGALSWPADKLEIQVLDDSTDETTSLAAAAVERLAARGIDAVLLHREDRAGFKAGALDAGLRVAKADLVAVFDADFVPQPDVLQRLVPHFSDPGVGMVQARWGHLNARESWLTMAQSILLDGHFVVEHAARHGAGRWFNFNGTAGIWRRSAIVEGGGWQHDTLTEDLDLSYRAQLAGWRFVYRADVVVPAELPASMAAFKTQQDRWARGAMQTARKLLSRIWRSKASLAVKSEATAHLTANLSYPLVVVLAAALPFVVHARVVWRTQWLSWLDTVLVAVAVAPFVLFYGAAVVRAGRADRALRLAYLPVGLVLGMGMAVSQSRAVVRGLGPVVGVFVRTPKAGGALTGRYLAHDTGLLGVELLLALWLWLGVAQALSAGLFQAVPFLMLFASGFSLVGGAASRR